MFYVGEPLFEKDNLNISRKNNRVTVSIQNVGSVDAGRYAITATNSIGNALSTADIVVKSKLLILDLEICLFIYFFQMIFSFLIIVFFFSRNNISTCFWMQAASTSCKMR